jgi:Na+/H+ antiporter NhaA
VVLLCGIGFTLSLLSPKSYPQTKSAVKIRAIVGSVLPGVLGAAVLAFAAQGRHYANA